MSGFSIHEDTTTYTVCDSCGGGIDIRKPMTPDDLRKRIAEYVRDQAEFVADDLVAELADDEEPTE